MVDVRPTLIALPPHAGLWIDVDHRGGINDSMANLMPTKGEPESGTRTIFPSLPA